MHGEEDPAADDAQVDLPLDRRSAAAVERGVQAAQVFVDGAQRVPGWQFNRI